jgi:hypothetical protein
MKLRFIRILSYKKRWLNMFVSSLGQWRKRRKPDPGVPGENHRPVASYWQTLSHNAVSGTPRMSETRTHNISGDRHWFNDCIGSYQSNYHTITATIISIRNWPPRYNWTIVESGVKHHNHNPLKLLSYRSCLFFYFFLFQWWKRQHRTHNISGDRHWFNDCIGSYQSNYHTITATIISIRTSWRSIFNNGKSTA